MNQLEEAFRLLLEGKNKEKAYEFDEELKPFSPLILNTTFPNGFKIPHVAPYDGTTDPSSHLSTFNTVMRANNIGYELRCIIFKTTLTRPEKNWFDKFRRHSISSWDQLSKEFKKQVQAAKSIKHEASTLTNVRKQPGESLKSYLARFNIEAAQARNVDDNEHLMAVRAGVLPRSPLWDDMQRKHVRTITEFTTRAQRFVNVEEARLALKLTPPSSITTMTNINSATTSAMPSITQPLVDNSSKRKNNEGNNPEADGSKKKKGDKNFSIYTIYTKITDTQENIFVMNENQVPFRRPDAMRHQRTKRDSNKFYRFHRDLGHTNDECRQLKEEIEGLI
ncbi:uncharacterized protein LOC133799959 [Humulus lupulus]|uniref:uncharacterized protein LOC133799959 n=1 Tax=Humulus lupulus TaxID=3486 RepID=UPI002B414925|nr:uncharacterized protein LOC133799959 [Humulus lupulus]